MSKQPKALEMAAWLESCAADRREDAPEMVISAELRRLHELNAGLVEALQVLMECREYGPVSDEADAWLLARAVLAKAEAA